MTDTSCLTASLNPLVCDVTCPGVGAIALSTGEWETDATGFIYPISNARVDDDPSTWRFNYGTEGVEVGVAITHRVVCFTPPVPD